MANELYDRAAGSPRYPRVQAYVAALEVEVDRLRRNNRLVREAVRAAVERLRQQLARPTTDESAPAVLAEARDGADQLAELLRDLREAAGYHPAHDQVVAIAVRPLAEQLFRWHQRLIGAGDVALRLELRTEHMDWFPARLRNILDNLISNALRFRDPAKTEMWVRVELDETPEQYHLRVSDNGTGLPDAARDRLFDLAHRADQTSGPGLGVGLAVVDLLLRQSGGSLEVGAGEGQGTIFRVVLPRFDLDDFLI